jgi:hypothetical protein
MLLQEALRACGRPAAAQLDYETLLEDPSRLRQALEHYPCATVKLESPGEAPALHKQLIERGWQSSTARGAPPRAIAHGELAHQHHWYAGLVELFVAFPADVSYLNAPADLLRMVDKLACQQQLANAGLPTPALLGPIAGYEEMRERLRQHDCTQAFIKARFGSSGAGVLAYRRHRDGREIATGPIEMQSSAEGMRLFNTLRQRRYTGGSEIAALVDTLAEQGAYLERWIPKPSVPGERKGHYDLRVVVLAGQPRQRIARISKGPLTNLHLGNRRLPAEAVLSSIGLATLEDTSTRAASAFPHSRLIGFDLIVRGSRAWLLEANGFGDLLLNVRWAGRTTYEDQAMLVTPDRLGYTQGAMHG